MALAEYKDCKLDCSIPPSLENLRGKSVIVTGGIYIGPFSYELLVLALCLIVDSYITF